jgi:hypothetical protein
VAGVSENLCFEFHYGHDLVTSGVLPMLQLVLAEVAPTMAAGLEVHAYERDPERRRIDLGNPGSLRAAVVAKGTERGALHQDLAASHGAPGTGRRFGHALLLGAGSQAAGFFLSVDFDTMTPARPSGDKWLWSNSISGRISRPVVEGIARQEWLLLFTYRLAAQTGIVWGAAWDRFARMPPTQPPKPGVARVGAAVGVGGLAAFDVIHGRPRWPPRRDGGALRLASPSWMEQESGCDVSTVMAAVRAQALA